MIFYVIAGIILLILIGLVIWLLVRQTGTATTPTGKKLGESCTSTSECNTGLICSSGNLPLATPGVISVCKVAPGGVCAVSADCSTGFGCSNGICVSNLGRLNAPCPCDTGFTCINNVCKANTGGICTIDSDCANGTCVNGMCMVNPAPNPNPTPPTCCSSSSTSSSNSDCSSYSNSSISSSNSDCSSYSHDKHKNSDKSWSWSQSWSDCNSDTSNSSNSSNSSGCKKKRGHHDRHDSHETDSHHGNSECSSENESRCGYLKRGVYSTNQNNNDQTSFTNIEVPIIDIAKPANNFMMLLGDGNMAMSSSTTPSSNSNITYMKTNKKMLRMVRFGNELVAIDGKGKLYTQRAPAPLTNNNHRSWNWEKLCNFPKNAIFINSLNNGTYLEVVTNEGRSYLYQYGANWMSGTYTSKRKTCTLRFYGKDTSRYIDINENYVGVTNDGTKYKHIKAAGFYNNNTIVQVLTSDSFTHVRIIDDRAYFLFEQC